MTARALAVFDCFRLFIGSLWLSLATLDLVMANKAIVGKDGSYLMANKQNRVCSSTKLQFC